MPAEPSPSKPRFGVDTHRCKEKLVRSLETVWRVLLSSPEEQSKAAEQLHPPVGWVHAHMIQSGDEPATLILQGLQLC